MIPRGSFARYLDSTTLSSKSKARQWTELTSYFAVVALQADIVAARHGSRQHKIPIALLADRGFVQLGFCNAISVAHAWSPAPCKASQKP